MSVACPGDNPDYYEQSARPREQLSQQLTSIKCTTLAPTKCSCSLELLTVVPSTKAGVINLAVGPAMLQEANSLWGHIGFIILQLYHYSTRPSLASTIPENIQPSIFSSTISRNISEPLIRQFINPLVFYSDFFRLIFNGLSLLLPFAPRNTTSALATSTSAKI